VPPTPLPELDAIHRLIELGGEHVQARSLCKVEVGGQAFDVPSISLGTTSKDAPAIGYFGGVHGLERIGAEVVIAYLASLIQRLRWDEVMHHQLERMRFVFMPLVNPGGLWLGTRANPRGVDLMRNAPIESREQVPWLLGGHRLSSALPWYRGPADAPMEAESQALNWLVDEELFGRPFSIALDCHSGFGLRDRVWFPYAHTRQPLPNLAELHALHRVFQQTHAHHNYVFEPQHLQYLTHGDLWDHLYLRHQAEHPARTFLPLTLEMGSWMWVKKNPRQLFSRQGIFNPLIAHRQQRVLRRHMALLDFLGRATASHLRWLPEPEERGLHERQARARWYQDLPRSAHLNAPTATTAPEHEPPDRP
jgi:hypothetical protein